jgi:phosphoglycolate phosphatase
MIDGLVFDKDGTLFDFRQSWGAWVRRLLEEMAQDAGHAGVLGNALGYDLHSQEFARSSPVIAGTAMDVAAVLLPHLPGQTQAGLAARLNALAQDAVMVPAVPLRAVLGALRDRGLRLGLATNDSEGPARAHLAAHGVLDLFEFVAGFDSGHGAKPGPGMCAAFARQTGLDPARVAMVGDSLHDLEAGRAAGMRRVAVLTGIAVRADLAPHADVVLADISDIGAWIDAMTPAS